jgi:hypothetical protein
MKNAALLVAAGLLVGGLAHEGWHFARRPPSPDSLDEQLRWVRMQVQLDSEQYARVRAVHEAFAPRLRQAGSDVARTRSTLQEFEDRRRSSGQVDFLAFKEFLDRSRQVDRQAAESTHELVAAVLAVMTPEQRARYLDLLLPVQPPGELRSID